MNKERKVPVFCAPMGYGKSTYFLVILVIIMKRDIHITLPTRELASSLYDDIRKAA